MSLELDGTQSPADAIREEINKMRKEAGFVDEGSEETVDTETDVIEPSDETEDDPFIKDTFEEVDNEPVITPREETAEYWKHRFDVVQGKYNAETARMGEQLSFLKGQIEELKSKPFEFTDQSNQSVSEILDDLEEEYGPEFTNAIDKRISRVVKEQVQEVVNGFQKDLTNVKQTTAATEQQMFEDVIDKLTPNWRSLNVNPEFVGWVQSNVETFSGVSFQDILVDAYNRRDAAKIAKIFNTYEQLKQKQSTKQTGTKAEANQLVSPNKRGSNSNATIENNSGKVFTQAQVQDFYQNLAQGAYAGKEAWVKSMKEEILKANAEGRIV